MITTIVYVPVMVPVTGMEMEIVKLGFDYDY